MLSTLKNDLSSALAQYLSSHFNTKFEAEKISEWIEVPKESGRGDLAFPCFALAKSLKKNPQVIATEIAKEFKLPRGFRSVEVTGAYLNIFYEEESFFKLVLSEIRKKGLEVGHQDLGRGKVAVFDYSSPNVAKPMSIGHLRSTVIGQALVNIFKAVGHKTVGINYLGDWGVQFGKLAWAHLNKPDLLKRAEKLKDQIDFDKKRWTSLLEDIKSSSEKSFDYLYAIYVVFHAVAEVDKELDENGREYFRILESRGNPKAQVSPLLPKIEEAWKTFIDVSLNEYQRVYKLLGTKHDLVRGESYYESRLPGVIEELKQKKLLKQSQGAQVVDLEPYGMPPCLITKSDGATLYATRDIAFAENRAQEFKGDILVYVVGAEQTLHFQQLFKVLELMGYPWAKDCIHVPFGLYRFKEGKMSTRRGNVVFLEDVLDRAIDLVKQIIKEKNPDLKNSESVAQAVGTGAVIFNDLMNDRQKNIDFDWDKLLDFNGDTGPYVQYSHVRCCSVLAKWNKPIPKQADYSLLKEKLERNLVVALSRIDDVIALSYRQLKPNWIAQYLLDVAKAFGAFYYEHRILEGDLALQEARLHLVDATRIILRRGLSLLGLQIPEAM